MNAKFIVVDGKTYQSVEEMPPDVRQKYEQAMQALGDANGNQIPDVLEDLSANTTVVNSMRIIVDGKEFERIEDLPPEVRARYEQAMSRLDANRNGIPDFVEGMINATNPSANISTSFETEPAVRSAPLPVSPAITPDTSNGWTLALAGLFLLGLCAAGAAAIWYFFLR